MLPDTIECETRDQEFQHKPFIEQFIKRIWNECRLEELADFLHDQFIDYSIPVKYLQNQTGTRLYLSKLLDNVSHHTIIDSYEEYDELIICHFTLNWEMDNQYGTLSGSRIFRIREGKILHHWECFD